MSRMILKVKINKFNVKFCVAPPIKFAPQLRQKTNHFKHGCLKAADAEAKVEATARQG